MHSVATGCPAPWLSSPALGALAITLLYLLSAPLARADIDSLRCGTRLVQKDDLAIQVRERCGKPVSKELIGYTLRGNYRYPSSRKREFKIEQWIYGPERGFYQVITFEAGRVSQIESIKE